MNVLQGISISLSPSSSQQECSAHDLTCIRDSWTPRTFRQQVTETALPLYLHCCRLPRFYILTGSRSELQQRPLLLSPFARVHFSALGRGTIFPFGGQLSLMCHNRFLGGLHTRRLREGTEPQKGHFCPRTTSQMVQSEQTWSPLHSIHFKHALNLPFKKFVWVMGRPGPQFSTSDVSLLKVYSSC